MVALQHAPRELVYLYKYRTWDNYTKRTLTASELFFSHPDSFNDPFDCQIAPGVGKLPRERVEGFARVIRRKFGITSLKARKKAQEILAGRQGDDDFMADFAERVRRDTLAEVGVCCFTERNDDLLMWSHYASAHRGICFQFMATDTTPFFGTAQPICYAAEYPSTPFWSDDEQSRLESILLTKAECWSYEKEWRMIALPRTAKVAPGTDAKTQAPRGIGVHKFPSHLLTGLVLGCRITLEDRSQVRELVSSRRHPVKIFQARKQRDAFALDIVELD